MPDQSQRTVSLPRFHLVKLCVGCDSVEELADWQRQRLAELRASGGCAELLHVTRQTPRREGFGQGSSLYWVIGGCIRVRQGIVALREIRDSDGVQRCGLALDPALVPTEPQPRRPFQGWRYLPAQEAPADLASTGLVQDTAMPAAMRAALAELRLI